MTLPIETQHITGVKCFGCAKYKPIVTHNNLKKQALCSRCNMKLIRKFGTKYGQVVADPAAALQGLEERTQEKKDLKNVRKAFYTILNLMEDYDLEPEQRVHVFRGFSNVLIGLPEADKFLTLNRSSEECEIESGSGEEKH